MAAAGNGEVSDEFNKESGRFIEWFRATPNTRLSTKIHLADLRKENAGRGVVAVHDIDEDEELFAIPRSLVLTTTTSSIPQSLLEPLEDTGSWPPLIVTIIYEYLKGKDSSWYPYFRLLPSKFETLMFWKSTELAELQGSAVVNKIGKAKAEENWKITIIPIMLQRPELFPVEGEDSETKTEKLIKLAHMAGSLLMAYAFDIDRDDDRSENQADGSEEFEDDDEEEPLKGMVPFADMLNADADRNNARLFQEGDFLIMKATKSIPAQAQIFNDYGPLPRSDLLRMYGYVTDNYARYDVVEIPHTLFEQVAGKADKTNNKAWLTRKDALDELGLIDDGYILPRSGIGTVLADAIPGQIHMLLRGLCMDENNTKPPGIKDKESLSIEEAALLSAILTKRLSEYSTSVEHDEQLLNKLKVGKDVLLPLNVHRNRYEIAIQVRMGEKEILQEHIRLCQVHIQEQTRSLAPSSSKRKFEGNQTSKKALKK